jgi:uncharacterized membrane protein/uncharacterized RDD family membrane protein YckC
VNHAGPSTEPAHHDVDAVPREARGIQGLAAGIVTRTAANTVDFIAVVCVLTAGYAAWFAVLFLVRPAHFRPPRPSLGVVLICGGVVLFAYFTASWATIGRTYGDHLLGLRVVDSRGARLRWRGALARAALCVAFPIGLFWSVVSARSRSVQDVVLRTAVVYDWAVGEPTPSPGSSSPGEGSTPVRTYVRAEQTAEEARDVADDTLQVFVAAFGDQKQAAAALQDFRAMDREGSIDLIDAVVVVRDAEGKVTFEETADPSGKRWAKRGAIAGGLVGLLFPPSIIAGAVVGGVGGGIWGKVRDKGFKDDDLKAIGDSLEPGTSAIIAIAEDRVVQRLVRGLEGYQRIAQHAVSAEAAALIEAEVDSDATPS